MKESIQRLLRRAPVLHRLSRWAYRAVRRTAGAVRTTLYMSTRAARHRLQGGSTQWRRELPVQRPLRHQLDFPVQAVGFDAFSPRGSNVPGMAQEGRDSLYLPPDAWEDSRLSFLMKGYPGSCGIKINKNEGGVTALYLSPHPGRVVQRAVSSRHEGQLMVFNYLTSKGVAPRLYDLLELEDSEGRLWTAYVVQHVEGDVPEEHEVVELLRTLRELTLDDSLRLVSNDGWAGDDFRLPDCKGNVLSTVDGRALYVDIHNFTLGAYDRFLEQLAEEVASTSHFGEERGMVGANNKRVLYQEVPGTGLAAKRSPSARMKVYDKLLKEAGVSLDGRFVLDVGCNLGLMSAEYLRRGAAWVHGWDRSEMVSAAHKVMLAIGCTRFSFTGVELDATSRLSDSLPAHISAGPADRVVLSYLAIRKHVGWIDGIREVPWRYMIYEGHEGDRPLVEYMKELNDVLPITVLASGTVSDAMSPPRAIAVVERLAP